ncbi:MAG: formyltransferase family protein [Thiobacillaceae bacterium]
MGQNRLLFLCSGGGGNLRFIHHAIQHEWLPGWSQITVIADRECPATEYARAASLTTICIDFAANEQQDLLDAAVQQQPDTIITTVHKILRPPLVKTYRGRLLNLHYSLLPAFGGTIGTRPVRAALDYGVRMAGATVHLVDETLDGGRPQVQVAVPAGWDDNLVDLMDVVFRAGCIALFTALKYISDPTIGNWKGSQLLIKDRAALLNPGVDLPVALADESFWKKLKQ